MRSADDVVAAIHAEVAKRGADGAYLNGWDPLLQKGLPDPTLAWLDGVADTRWSSCTTPIADLEVRATYLAGRHVYPKAG